MEMKIVRTSIEGLLVLEPNVFEDARGYFLESFHYQRYLEAGIATNFIQDNESKSTRGVIRGLHYQVNPFSQAKLVRVVEGCVFDVAVDLRPGSATFGKWFGVELSGSNKKQMFIPRDFAHGFSVLSETAVFSYKCDNYYSPQHERGILYNDPDLNINWQIPEAEAVVSEKDKKNNLFRTIGCQF
jgi:dTDP-4-dehydrorhamnose 3,5-epimerase